ncbi:uncharacterized protein LOC111489922 [Cucurbita maxima]|uniref:Uncharacterized protein LOC111489922 n=1 Tax=Cucurbita maxima TaxID=3661 RepID=A0A6J1K1Y4_CUCMA|nr:uncharacterized protein LOC111489922 [Cucurbita maxima]
MSEINNCSARRKKRGEKEKKQKGKKIRVFKEGGGDQIRIDAGDSSPQSKPTIVQGKVLSRITPSYFIKTSKNFSVIWLSSEVKAAKIGVQIKVLRKHDFRTCQGNSRIVGIHSVKKTRTREGMRQPSESCHGSRRECMLNLNAT